MKHLRSGQVMITSQMERAFNRLGEIVAARRSLQTDAELLHLFASTGDERAFAEIMTRHGGLVRSVCRRVLGDHPGVDDAWQATFLVFARRASRVFRSGSLAGWLHGVAYRASLSERRACRRRTKHEAEAQVRCEGSPESHAAWHELMTLLDSEIERLPAPLREVFVRVCLQDSGCNEVSAELQLNEGTVRSRLARARHILRHRLERRGVCLFAAITLATVSQHKVAASLHSTTISGAVAIALGKQMPPGTVSVRAAVLGRERKRSLMYVPKFTAGVLVLLGTIGLGVAQLGQKSNEPAPKEPTPHAKIEVLDALGDPLPTNAVARFGTNRFRPGGSITALAFEPSGKRLASISDSARGSEKFTIWEAESGKELRADLTASNTFVAFAWPSNGIGMAIVSEPHNTRLMSLKVWEFSAEKPGALRAPTADGARIAVAGQANRDRICHSADISADGKRIAIATAIGETPDVVLILETKPNCPVTELKKLAEFETPSNECRSLTFTPDGKRLVGLCPTDKFKGVATAGKLIVWDSDGKIERTIDVPKYSQQGSRATFAASNAFVALGLEDGDSLLVEIASGKPQTIKTGHKPKSKGPFGTYAVAFSHDGKCLASAGRDGMVRVYDIASNKIIREFGPHGSWPEAIAWSSDDRRIASAGQDAVIRLWDPITGKEVGPTGGNIGHVWRASISNNGKTAVTDGGLGIRVWDCTTGAERRRFSPGGNVTYCSLSPDSKHVVAIVGPWEKPERAIRVWDIATGEEALPIGFPKTLIASGFRFAPDGQSLITYQDEKLTAWTWPTGNKLWATEMPKPVRQPGVNQIQSIAFSPDGRQFITVGERYWFREERGLRFGYGADGVVDLWDSATGKLVRRLIESNSCFRAGQFATNGLYIHSGGGTFPGDVRGGSPHTTKAPLCAVDPLTGRLIREFGKAARADGFDSGYTTALSADGKVLFRATGIGEIHLYEVATGSYRMALVGHKASVLALDTPSDVRRVISGSWDTLSLLWDVGLCSKTGAKLSVEERERLWETLKEVDGSTAYKAMTKLGGDPEGFLATAKASLKPAPEGPRSADLNPIFTDLDSKTFAKREAASAKLAHYGESAITLVRNRLETERSAEVRDRLKRFLEKYDGAETSPTRLHQSRVVELLEHLGTAEAKELLRMLASGGESYLTTDAKSAIKRIERR